MGCDLWILEHSSTGQYDGSWVHGLPSKIGSHFCDEHLDWVAKLFKSLPSVPQLVPTVAAPVVEGNPAEAEEHLVADGSNVPPPGVQAVTQGEQPASGG